MAAEDEPVLRAPRVPISGLDMAAAVPSMEMARSIQKAMASGDVSRFLARIASKRLADAVISPELRRTLEELHKVFDSPQMVATRKQLAEIGRGAKSPAADASHRQRL